jgi:hypothetical protein
MKKKPSPKNAATNPLAENKNSVAGRTAQKSRKAAPAKKSRASKPRVKEEALPEWERSIIDELEIKRRKTKRLKSWEIGLEDPPPVPPIEGEPPRYLPIRNITPATPQQWKVPLGMKIPLFDWPPFRELIEAIFKAGWYDNKAGWREAMIILAKQDERCRQVLGQWLSVCAVQLKREELDLFARAVERISNAPERANQKRVYALMFVLRCAEKTGFLPTQNKVRQFLKKIGFVVDETKEGNLADPRKNEARDLFKGPVLGNLPKGKPGRPRSQTGS